MHDPLVPTNKVPEDDTKAHLGKTTEIAKRAWITRRRNAQLKQEQKHPLTSPEEEEKKLLDHISSGDTYTTKEVSTGCSKRELITKETGEGITEACHPECERVKMKCLSVRQPWANAIFKLSKDCENRSWCTTYRGPMLIHASQRIAWQAAREGPLAKRLQSVTAGPMPTSAIIGVVLLLDVVRNSPSEWAEPGSWHWLLAEPRLLAEPIACAGKLRIFEVEVPLGVLEKAHPMRPLRRPKPNQERYSHGHKIEPSRTSRK